jgi:hypothetical protein
VSSRGPAATHCSFREAMAQAARDLAAAHDFSQAVLPVWEDAFAQPGTAGAVPVEVAQAREPPQWLGLAVPFPFPKYFGCVGFSSESIRSLHGFQTHFRLLIAFRSATVIRRTARDR